MSLTTIDTDRWHARYAALADLAQAEEDRGGDGTIVTIKDAIDRAWDGVAEAFKVDGFQADNSDLAEEVIGVLTRYLFASNAGPLMAHVSLLIDAKTPLRERTP